MIKSKKLIPEVYSQSYDMFIFTALLDLVYTSRELDILRMQGSHLPSKCFEEDLMSLASLFGLGATVNRELIANYRKLVKHKGTSLAVEALVCLAANLPLTKNSVILTMEGSDITTYADFSTINLELLELLLRKLAPATTFIRILPIEEYSKTTQATKDSSN